MKFFISGLILCCALAAQTTIPKPLEIYVVDVEGGKADLWVMPSGETLLVDTGSPGGQDARRILEVMAAAHVSKIDNLLLTHYHSDHVGGLQELAPQIPPISHFFDHGPTVEDGLDGRQPEMVPGFQAAYAKLYSKAQHTVLKVGDRIPLPGVDWRIVTSAGKLMRTALPGGGKANQSCQGAERETDRHDPENGQSAGSVITFGRFRAVDLGDLTSDREYDLMCPKNPIGKVDVYFVSNHGMDNASTPELVHAIEPRVAVIQNGPRKGATVNTLKTLYSSPGLQSIWQLHWAERSGMEYNPAGIYIANVESAERLAKLLLGPPTVPGHAGMGADPDDKARWLKLSVQPSGAFTIENSRDGFTRTYLPSRR